MKRRHLTLLQELIRLLELLFGVQGRKCISVPDPHKRARFR